MLTTTKEMLEKARAEGYAVPAINTQGGNFDIIRAVCLSAEKNKSPIILAHYASTGAYAGHDWFVEVCKWWAGKVSVPVAIHLDHGDSFELCKECVDLGFTSVMIDGSNFPHEKNAQITNQVIEFCKGKNIPVEAEIGELLRLDEIAQGKKSTNTVKVEDVKTFLSLCKPESLAIGIGNAHGYYAEEPVIKLEILEEVAKFSRVPLVLHGCTGMSEEIIKKAIKMGVAKINFGTQIRYDYVNHLKEQLNETNHQGHSWKIMEKASDQLILNVDKIIELSGSKNKA